MMGSFLLVCFVLATVLAAYISHSRKNKNILSVEHSGPQFKRIIKFEDRALFFNDAMDLINFVNWSARISWRSDFLLKCDHEYISKNSKTDYDCIVVKYDDVIGIEISNTEVKKDLIYTNISVTVKKARHFNPDHIEYIKINAMVGARMAKTVVPVIEEAIGEILSARSRSDVSQGGRVEGNSSNIER